MQHLNSGKYLLSLLQKNYCSKSFYSTEISKFYDIIIAGGGMVGTTLACALGMNTKLSDKKILLLERSKEFKWELSEKYSNRVVALTPHTQKLLNNIKAWQHISNTRFGTVKKMQVWDACSDAMITFNNDDLTESIAYIVENDLLLSAVNNVVKNMKNVTVINEAKIKDYKLPKKIDNIVEISMDNGNTYTCNLLVGADGAKSKVRESMAVQYLKWNYKQMAVVATLKLSECNDNIVAWQRFLPSGPIALLPLTENQSSLVWTTTPEHAKELLQMPEDQFVDCINNALWKIYARDSIIDVATKGLNNLLENLNFASNAVRQLPPNVSDVEPSSRAAFPLGFGHASNYVSKCVALVGDAAHRVHPLAGQGVNLGFGDVSCLSDILGKAAYSGQNIGSIFYLKEYERTRQIHNVPTMFAIDALQKLYCTDVTPFVVLRSVGLQITHAMNPVKKMIIQHAAS